MYARFSSPLLLLIMLSWSFAQAQPDSVGLHFDGTGDYVRIPHKTNYDLGTNPFTIEGWVEISSSATYYPNLISTREGNNPFSGMMFGVNLQGKLWCQLDGSNLGGIGPDLRDDTCHHIALVRDTVGSPDTVRYILDGQEIHKQSAGFRNITTTHDIWLGYDHPNGAHKFKGVMRQVRLWNIARTAAQINTNKSKYIGGSTTGLIGCWRMNEDSGQVVKDYSSLANDGFLGASLLSDNKDPSWSKLCETCKSFNVSIMNLDTAVCLGDSVTFTASGAQNYSWNNGITNGQAFAASTSGTYIVTGTDPMGCIGKDSVHLTINPLPSIGISTSASTLCEGDSAVLSGTGAVTYSWNRNVVNGVPFTPLSAGPYVVTGTDSNNCVDTASIHLKINSAPQVAVTATDTAICRGSQVWLYGHGASFYLWSSGVADSVMIQPAQSEYHNVTGVGVNGCQQSDSIMIQVHAVPVAFNTVVNETQGNDGAIDLSVYHGTPPYLFDWDNDGIGDWDDPEDLSGLASGTYTVWISDSNSCRDSATITVGSHVGIESSTASLDIKLFPNPGNGQFYLTSSDLNLQQFNVEVYQTNGQLVQASIERNAKGITVQLAESAPGMYLVRAYHGQLNYRQLILVK